MQQLNAIIRVPRSGSTLLCNILAQNPNFQVSGTSFVPTLVNNMMITCQALEFKHLVQTEQNTQQRWEDTIAAALDAWYEGDKVAFDKAPGWLQHIPFLAKLDGKAIIIVRRIADVMGSIIHHEENTAEFGSTNRVQVCEQALAPDGFVGSVLNQIVQIAESGYDNVVFIRHEDLVEAPSTVIEQIYDFLGLEQFEHQFENVENKSNEADGHMLLKFPHKGKGKVKKQETNRADLVPESVKEKITQVYGTYNSIFEYDAPQKRNKILK